MASVTLAESAGDYELAGHMIAYFVVHGGPAPQFLSETAYNCLLDDEPRVAASDISDITLRSAIMQV